jgi:hypothetical protein
MASMKLNDTSRIISFYGSFNSLNEIKQESQCKQKILVVLNDDLKDFMMLL